MTSWEARVNPELAEPVLMGGSPAGTKRCEQSPGVGPLGPSTAPDTASNESGRGTPVRSKRRWGQRQGWRQGYSVGPKFVNESGLEAGLETSCNFCPKGPSRRWTSNSTISRAMGNGSERGLETSTLKCSLGRNWWLQAELKWGSWPHGLCWGRPRVKLGRASKDR